MIIKVNNKRKEKLSTKPSDYKDAINDEAIFGAKDHSLVAVETGVIKLIGVQLSIILFMLQWEDWLASFEGE